jgi:hypothetical protein
MTTGRPRPIRVLATVLFAPLAWLERARGWKRLALGLCCALAAAALIALAARSSALRGLPDVGDPFDVAAYRAAAADDAAPLYRQALARYRRPGPSLRRELERFARGQGRFTPSVLAWIDDNREALELWRQAADRRGPAGAADAVRELDRGFLPWVARVKARRLRWAGDAAGAWAWHRAGLRFNRHVARLSDRDGRLAAMRQLRTLCERASEWAQDPRVDAPLLRRALADVQDVAAMTPPLSDLLKAQYLDAMATLDDPPARLVEEVRDEFLAAGGADLWYRYLPPYWRAAWFLGHEPERSRRLVRLVFANWLAYCDRPPSGRPALLTSPRIDLFAAAGTPGPRDLLRRVAAPCLAGHVLERWGPIEVDFDDERSRQALLVVAVAEQLYIRERGEPPDSPEALVGPYLPALPDGYDSPTPPAGPC